MHVIPAAAWPTELLQQSVSTFFKPAPALPCFYIVFSAENSSPKLLSPHLEAHINNGSNSHLPGRKASWWPQTSPCSMDPHFLSCAIVNRWFLFHLHSCPISWSCTQAHPPVPSHPFPLPCGTALFPTCPLPLLSFTLLLFHFHHDCPLIPLSQSPTFTSIPMFLSVIAI